MRSACAAALAAAVLLSACSGKAVTSSTVPAVPAAPAARSLGSYIKHVVVIVQENRSFEQVFAGWPGADAPMYGRMSTGQRVALHSMRFEDDQDLGHLWQYAMLEWDHGKMDGFDLDQFGSGGGGPKVGQYAYTYIDRAEIGPYRALARDYVLGDRFFATEFGGSFTAHQDLVAGETRIDANHSLVDWPTSVPWGCDAPRGTTTSLIDLNRIVTTYGPFPCLTQYATIADTLDAKGVSWKYYTQATFTFGGEVWNAFDSNKRVRYGIDWSRNVIVPDTKALTDPANGALASVTFVIPDAQWSDHPAIPSSYGPSWVGDVVNEIGQSKYWKDTVIVVMWDDWGGFYDNAPPPQLDSVGLGMRMPVLIVSPYARRGYVSHTQYEYGSILKFIEQAFNLPSLHSTDDRANSLIDAFDFKQKPRPFVHIQTQHPPKFFLTIKLPKRDAAGD
jgi:phospholipase C